MRTYTTVQGDEWDLIAYKRLKNEYAMSDLISLNQQYVSTIVFDAGVQLVLPDPPPSKSLANIPPWVNANQVS